MIDSDRSTVLSAAGWPRPARRVRWEGCRDFLALVRSYRVAGRVPAIRSRAASYVAEYRLVVGPIVRTTLGTDGYAKYQDESLCETVAEVSFLMSAFSSTANVPFRADLAVLGVAFCRVYDDLFDDYGDDDLAQRISSLFAGGQFSPTSAVERFFLELYVQIDTRLGRLRSDPYYSTLALLNKAQARSRGQRDDTIRSSDISDIARAKGGYGATALFGLMLAEMDDRERSLIHDLGEALQLADDYLDVEADRAAGISTTATRGELSLAHICRLVRSLRPRFRDCYGRSQPLLGTVYANLWICFLRRRFPRLLAATARLAAVSLANSDRKSLR